MRAVIALVALMTGALLIGDRPAASSRIDIHDPLALATERADNWSPDDVAGLSLYVIKDGSVHQVTFSFTELVASSVITIDGYVGGVALVGTSPTPLSVAGRPMKPIGSDNGGHVDPRDFGRMSRQAFRPLPVSAGEGTVLSGEGGGGYYRFAKVPGDALSTAPEFPVTIRRDGRWLQLTVRQATPVRLTAPALPGSEARIPEFHYLGNRADRYAQSSSEFRQRIHAIVSGIQSVERQTGMALVDRVRIIDLKGQRNAYTFENERQIWIYSGLFWNEPVAELKAIAEHEALHILSDRLALPTNTRLRSLYADLMAFGAFSREYVTVIATGRPPGPLPSLPNGRKESLLFDFINERHFIPGLKGGHAKDGMDEFCASYLHTLIHIRRLQQALQLPLKQRDGTPLSLSAKEKGILLNDYMRVLNVIAEEIPEGRFPRIPDLLASCEAAAARVEACLQ